MVTATKETFNYAYELSATFVDGATHFKIVDTLSHNGTIDPAATGVTLRDPDGGILQSGNTARVTGATDVGYPFDPGKYTFVSTATVKDHGTTISGLIIEDTGGHYFLLTDTQYTGNLN